uniref:Uncharacterized protein n=1 Tax=Romanomermis culicivorax TaxID=13658 RepID=A0A915K5B2_ROMCU
MQYRFLGDCVWECRTYCYPKCIGIPHVSKVGFGLTLVLNVAKKSYPAAIHGAVLTIMDNYTSPGGLTDVLLQAGQWSKIIMDASRYTMLNTNSYSTKQDCFDDEQEKPVYKSFTNMLFWNLMQDEYKKRKNIESNEEKRGGMFNIFTSHMVS